MPSITNRRRSKNTAPVTQKWSDSDSDANQYSSFVESLEQTPQDKLDTNEIDFRLNHFKQRKSRQPPKKTFEDENADDCQFEGGGKSKKRDKKKDKDAAQEEADEAAEEAKKDDEAA